MENIGQKIIELRKSKGLTQEELAEKAKVNLRTIQRIEKEENKPSGNTLKLICEALDTLPEKIVIYGKKEDINIIIMMHLSVITYFVIPIGNIIIPLIFWLSKKDKVINLDEKGMSLLNFQIVWTILTTISFISMGLTSIFELTKPDKAYISYLFLLLFVLLNIANVLMAIIIAARVKTKSKFTSYPNLIKLIR